MGKNKKEVKKEIKKEIEPGSLGLFFNELAAALDGKNADIFGELTGLFENMSEMSVKIINKDMRYEVKLKVEQSSPPPGNPPEVLRDKPDQSIQKYKDLKKRMKKAFREIGQALEENRMPEKSMFDAFLEDCRRMVTYPGHGDPHYDTFSKACDQFRQAFDRADFSAFQTGFAELGRLKNFCHREYK